MVSKLYFNTAVKKTEIYVFVSYFPWVGSLGMSLLDLLSHKDAIEVSAGVVL